MVGPKRSYGLSKIERKQSRWEKELENLRPRVTTAIFLLNPLLIALKDASKKPLLELYEKLET